MCARGGQMKKDYVEFEQHYLSKALDLWLKRGRTKKEFGLAVFNHWLKPYARRKLSTWNSSI